MQKNYIEQEWRQMLREERRFLNKNRTPEKSGWQERVADYVPDKLEGSLHTAFYKAFELIFEKGTGMIEKTCRKEEKRHNYRVHEYAVQIRGNRKTLQAFGKEAKAGKFINTAVSAAEGIGMGVFGMGIPDIPVFLAVLLKSIYEIALSYGFSYDTEEEQVFILRLIEAALSHEEELDARDAALNRWIWCSAQEGERGSAESASADAGRTGASADESAADGRERTAGELPVPSRREQMRRTSDALAAELLYLKFVQGIPVIGVAGGLSDVVYQKKISDYAALKYKRRFLEKKRRGSGKRASQIRKM